MSGRDTPIYDEMCAAITAFHAHQDEFYSYLATLPEIEQAKILVSLCDPKKMDRACIAIRIRAEKQANRMIREAAREAALDRMVVEYCKTRGLKVVKE